MKPEANLSGVGFENAPVGESNRSAEYAPSENNQESGIENTAERTEQIAELRSVVADVGMTTMLPTPVSNDPSVADDKTPAQFNNPVIASDDDLIEKEWVDKAKKIVESTKNDPHRRENEVGKLRVDYIKKRFGREIGSAD